MSYLDNVKADAKALTWYASLLKNWPARWAGSKPSNAMLMVPHLLGKRPGVEALHIAMCLRPEGCTVQQFQTAGSCGPANNYRRSLVKTGWFTMTVEGKPYAFKLAISKKGEARLDKCAAAYAEAQTVTAVAPKAKAKRISHKANVTKAPVTPVSEAPAVTEAPATVEAPQLEALAAHFNA